MSKYSYNIYINNTDNHTSFLRHHEDSQILFIPLGGTIFYIENFRNVVNKYYN